LATIAELMAISPGSEFEFKELTMTVKPASGMLETLNHVRQRLGFAGDSNAEIGNPGLFSTDDSTSVL
jgi:hypothetical protein